MKPYFVAALSFVGVLGSAAGAMAINNDTLTHGGSELTESASRSLISTSTVNPDGTISIEGTPSGLNGSTPGATPAVSADPNASTPALSLTNLPTVTWNGTTGGSSAGNAGSATTPAHSAARPIATPAAGAATPVNGVTGGSAAAPAPGGSTSGNGSAVTKPARGSHPERGKKEERHTEHEDDSDDEQESSDD